MKSLLESRVSLFIFLVFILLIHGLAIWFKLYYLFWWLDTALHFFGGVWIVLFFNFFIKHFGLNLTGARARPVFFMIFLGLTELTGILWEFFEFGFNRYITHIGFLTYEDTLSDLFFDLLGGIIGLLLVL